MPHLTVAEAVAIAGVLIALSHFLSNTYGQYLQRKQMRQNELFRTNPLVGVELPPSKLRLLAKKHGYKAVYYINLIILVAEWSSPSPVTRTDVVIISVNVGCMVLMITLKALLDGLQITVRGIVEGLSTVLRA